VIPRAYITAWRFEAPWAGDAQVEQDRDLFDLWVCLDRNIADPDKVVACFECYMQKEGNVVSRAEFEANLYAKQTDAGFLNDVAPLLTPNIEYDAKLAFSVVLDQLVSRLPGAPWRGDRV